MEHQHETAPTDMEDAAAAASRPQLTGLTSSSVSPTSGQRPMSLAPELGALNSTLSQEWERRHPHASFPDSPDSPSVPDGPQLLQRQSQQPAWACAVCHDIGWLRLAGVPTDRPASERLARCGCQVEADARRRQQRLRALSGLDADRAWLTFATFDPSIDEDGAEALAFAQAFAADPFGYGWVTYFGQPGLGKTHLLEATACELITRGVPTLYVSAAELLAHVRRGFDNASARDSAEERIAQAARAEVLLLDDLGAQSATAWADETLWRVLDARYRRRQAAPTMTASNCMPHELEPRIGSRIRDKRLCRTLTLFGEDYRLRADH